MAPGFPWGPAAGCAPAACLADNGYYSASNLERAQAYTDLYVPDKTFDTKLRIAPDYHFGKFT